MSLRRYAADFMAELETDPPPRRFHVRNEHLRAVRDSAVVFEAAHRGVDASRANCNRCAAPLQHRGCWRSIAELPLVITIGEDEPDGQPE